MTVPRMIPESVSSDAAAARPKLFFLMMFSKCLAILLVLATHLGCSSLTPRPDVDDFGADGFAVSGRLGVNRGTDGFSSSFLWRFADPDFDIELWGPLGQGRTRIEGRGDAVTIVEGNGTVHHERDTAQTMERWLGVSVPVSALVHWLRGEPAPESPAADQRFDGGDRTHLAQLEWELDFTGYRDVAGGGRVPSRIVARRGDVQVTLLPKEWTFPSTAR